ncbi:MAG: hypothetical protein Q4G03_04180 [Planctomycetia bacterium]|nr:hypothetical protein [Planctomycetia bacterium]
MSEPLFQVTCPSCETTFEVTDPELVGQIVECPKCGGMILVQAPNESALELETDDSVASPPSTDASHDGDSVAFDASSAANNDRKPRRHDVSEIESQEEDLDEVAENPVWSTRIVLILSGIFCALLVVVLIFLLRLPQKTEHSIDLPADAEENFQEALEQTEQIEDDYIIHQELIDEEAELASDQFDASVSFDQDDLDEESDTEPESDTELAQTPDVALNDAADEPGSDDVLPSDSGVIDNPPDLNDATDETSSSDAIVTESDSETANASEPQTQAQDSQADAGANDEADEIMVDDVGQNVSTTEVNSVTALPSLKAQPQAIDITKRLHLAIASLSFPPSPIGSVQLLSELAGAPVEFDTSCLILLRPSFRSQLDLSLTDTTIQNAFTTLGAALKWNVSTQVDRVEISPENYNAEMFVEERFDVAALLSLDATAPLNVRAIDSSELTQERMTNEDLVNFITTLVAPEDWIDPDLAVSLTCEGNEIVVRHNAAVRKRVEYLIEQLHVLHDSSYVSKVSPELLIPEALSYNQLNKQVAFNLFQPETLEQALGKLERSQKIIVMWDDVVLNAFGAGRTSTTVAHIEKSPVHDVIDALLEPLGLSYVTLDVNAILITTNERARDLKTIELHVVEDRAGDANGLWELANEMRRMIAPNSWEQHDVALWLDVDSGVWAIRQSEPVQREIRNWLAKRLSGETAPTSTAPEIDDLSEPTQDDSNEEEPADLQEETTVELPTDEIPLEEELDLSGLGDDLDL